jgi:hypothetical protein
MGEYRVIAGSESRDFVISESFAKFLNAQGVKPKLERIESISRDDRTLDGDKGSQALYESVAPVAV